MLIRVLLLLLLCSVARAEGQSQERADDSRSRSRSPERRPASNSIPHFDHAPGEQHSIPARNSIPDKPVGPAWE